MATDSHDAPSGTNCAVTQLLKMLRDMGCRQRTREALAKRVDPLSSQFPDLVPAALLNLVEFQHDYTFSMERIL
jgi:hypothetical protein